MLVRFCLFLFFYFLLGDSAWATQEHADPEGLYSHQIAHFFFMFSMLFLLIQIRRSSTLKPGWKHIGIAALLFLLWNVNVSAVHWLREHLQAGTFTGSSDHWRMMMNLGTWEAGFFYAGKIMDHFLSVAALIFFVIGIRKFLEGMEREARQ